MFWASLVQDYYPDILLIMMLNVDTGLRLQLFFKCFWNSVSEGEAELDGIFLVAFDFIISVTFNILTL